MICAAPIQRGALKGQPATGTPAGWWRHKRASEEPCDACYVAYRQYINGWARANPKQRDPAYLREWYRANPDKRREYDRRWREGNPAAARRKQRHVRLDGVLRIPYTTEELDARLSMFPGCWLCGGEATEVDHVKPVSAGGPDALSNLRPVCRSCNAGKADTWPLDHMEAS